MEKHKGLAAKYFIPGPPLPFFLPLSALCSAHHGCEGQENTFQLWHPESQGTQQPARGPRPSAPRNGMLGFKSQLGSWWSEIISKKALGQLCISVFQTCMCSMGFCLQTIAVHRCLFFPNPCRELPKPLQCKTCLAEVDGHWQHPTAEPPKYLCPLESKPKQPELFGTDLGANVPNKEKNASC